MKKLYFGIMFLMMSIVVCAAPRTREEAAALAAQFQNEQAQKSGVRRAPAKAANMRLAKQVAKPKSQDAALYVFNNPNGGWVIISGDDNAETIIGYSNEGQFDATGKANVLYMLDYFAERVDAASQMTDSEKARYAAARKARKQVEPIAPLLQSKGTGINWNQGAPYNGMCPIDGSKHSLTGCVATAAAQIMAYWQWPKTGEGYTEYEWFSWSNGYSIVSANFGEATYDWDNILQANYEKIDYTQAQADAVALLNFHAGAGAHLSYSATGTGGGTDEMGYAMKHYFRYKRGEYIHAWESSSSSTGWKKDHNLDTTGIGLFNAIADLFDADLEAGRPILMGGGNTPGGHEFVCEGRDADRRYYINYGWGGSDNGYFYLSAMNPKDGYEFSHDIDAVMGIYPDTLPRVAVTAVSLNKHSLNLTKGESGKLEATITPSNAGNDGIYWTSSDRSVVTTNQHGSLTAVAPGVATITVTSCDGGHKDSCIVVVEKSSNALKVVKLAVDKIDYAGWHDSDQSYDLYVYSEATQYPYLWFFRVPTQDPNIYSIAGYSKIKKEGLYVWPSDEDHSKEFYAEEGGWVNFTCLGPNTYRVECEFVGKDGITYQVNSVVTGSIWQDQEGDGAMVAPEVTFMSMGEKYHSTIAPNGKLHLPSDAPKNCDELSFVGWTTDANFTNGTTAPVLANEGDDVAENTTYYAVYGAKDGVDSYTEVASVSFNTFDEDGDDHYWYDPGYHYDEIDDLIGATSNMTLKTGAWLRKGKDGIRVGGSGSAAKGDNQGYVLFNLNETKNIKKVVVNCSKVGDEFAKIRVDMNNAEPQKTDPIQEVTGDELEFILDKDVETDSIRVGTTCNSAYFKSIKLYSGGEQNYNYYTTSTCPIHAINIASANYGQIETDITAAYVGDVVTIKATDKCSALKSISVKDADNNDVEINNNQFSMPASDVTISATVEAAKYGILIADVANGEISTNVATAAGGETVTITITPAAHYDLSSINAVDADNNLIDIENDGSFIMPCANVTITGSFAEQPKYTINFYNNGELINSQELYNGDAATKPADPTAECSDYTFAGWWNEELAADNTEAKTWISDITCAGADQDYYAIYSKSEGGNAKNDTLTLATTSQSGSAYGDWTADLNASYSGNNAGSYESIQLRSKNSNSGIVTTASNINASKVSVVWNNHTSGTGTLDIYGKGTAYTNATDLYDSNKQGTALGSIVCSSDTELKISGNYPYIGLRSHSGALYINQIIITWGAAGTTYYTSAISCIPTAIENTKMMDGTTIKVIENGQVVIIRGNEKYNIFGQKIQ